jgi:DNA-binding CsgD family transcriptional regulator
MALKKNLGNEIIRLRVEENRSYPEIKKILNCSLGSIYYHCSKNDLNDTGKKKHAIPEEMKTQIQEFCKTHTIKQAMAHFNLCYSTIAKFKLPTLNSNGKKTEI